MLKLNFIICCFFFTTLVFSSFVSLAQEPKSRDDWRGFVEVARKSYQEGDYEKALLYYQNATLKAPKTVDLTNEIAQTHYRLDQLENANEWYNRSKKNAETEFNKGNVAFKKKDFRQSIQHYKDALRQNADFPEARTNLSIAMRELKKNPPPPQSNNNPPPPQKNTENDQSKKEKESGLSDKSVDRILNQLAKNEAETKRKINNGSKKSTEPRANKNW